jgi:hypothetical protein
VSTKLSRDKQFRGAQKNRLNQLEKISVAYLCTVFSSLGIAWLINYFPTNINLVQRISFISEDKPWLAGGLVPQKILGMHYFGDFQSALAFTIIDNPYLTTYLDRSNLLPSSKIFLYPLAIIPLKVSFGIYVLLSIFTLVVAIRKLIKHIERQNVSSFTNFQKIVFCLLVFGFSRPFLTDLDRGNFYTFTISLIILSIVYFRENKIKLAATLLVIAVSIKSFLIFPLLPFLPWKKIRFLITLCAVFVLLNFTMALTYSMKAITVLENVYLNQSNYLNANFLGYVMNAGSLSSSFSRIIEYIYGTENTISFLEKNLIMFRVLSLIYLAFALLTAFLSSKFEVKFFFSLSLITFAPPYSGWYAMSWISFALLAYVLTEREKNESRLFKWLVLIVSWCLLIPLWVQIPVPGSGFNQQFVIPPILSLLFCIRFLYSKSRDHKKGL